MAREEYSDPTSEAVGRIETQVDEIEVLVTEIKETDLANLEENIYTPLKYKPFVYNFYGVLAQASTWQEVINITGVGYVTTAVATATAATSGKLGVRITIDGVEMMSNYGFNSNPSHGMIGLLNQNELVASANGTFELNIGSLIGEADNVSHEAYVRDLIYGVLPFSTTSGGLFTTDNKIGFKQSLKIELQSSSLVNLACMFKGGVE